MGVEEIFLVMGQAPFGEDRAAAGNDPGHSLSGQGDKSEQDAGVNRKIIDSLFALLEKRIAKNFPGELFGFSVYLFERLIDRNGSDWHRGIAQNPLAGLVNIFPG